MPPREMEAPAQSQTPPRARGAMRVVVTGATAKSASAAAAAMLSTALTLAGLENDSVEVVHAGSTLDGMNSAYERGAWKFVVVTGTSAATLTAAFAMVKAIEARSPGARIEMFVTGQDESRAHAAYQCVRSATERFLGRDVSFAGALTDLDAAPVDGSDEADSTRRRATRASRSARMWAARLLAECSEGAWPEAAHTMN